MQEKALKRKILLAKTEIPSGAGATMTVAFSMSFLLRS
jgi:hypothetical protein